MILTQDTQVAPLIEVFELYMMRDAPLSEMREPTAVATRAMLNTGLSPELVLTILHGAVRVAAAETGRGDAEEHARELRDQMGSWLMEALFDPNRMPEKVTLAA
ncbi:MAG: hypothetical protein ACHQQP_05405 [Gemmatimonadales bacterium]